MNTTTPSNTPLRVALTAGTFALILLLVWAWYTGWFVRAWYQSGLQDTDDKSLSSYRVTIEARPLAGIPRNATGLTYHAGRNTLFTVINSPAAVAELSIKGEVLRIIPVYGLNDVEGISHISGDNFVLAGEADQLLVFTRIDDTTESLDLSNAASLGIAIDMRQNAGFEGVSWDSRNQRLMVVKEKHPIRVLQIEGLMQWYRGENLQVLISEWEPAQGTKLWMADLSSITFHEASGHMILLSDESHLALQLDAERKPVGMLALRAGQHGLSAHVPQAEGISMTPEGALYLISEPNLFYRFDPPLKALVSE